MTPGRSGRTRRPSGRVSRQVEFATLTADLTGPLALPELDGLVAANSLHYVARDRQVVVIRALAAHLRPGGRFVVVEYDADRGNPWVPHPFSYPSWERLAESAGLIDTSDPMVAYRVASSTRSTRRRAAARRSPGGSLP